MKNDEFAPLSFQVPFDEADKEGIVFFGNYFRLAHRALELFLPQLGITWKDWFSHPEWGSPLRHVEADYLRPLWAGETYTVRIWVEKLGESSVHFAYEFCGADGQVTTRMKTSHVFVRRRDLSKVTVPAIFLNGLKKAPRPRDLP